MRCLSSTRCSVARGKLFWVALFLLSLVSSGCDPAKPTTGSNTPGSSPVTQSATNRSSTGTTGASSSKSGGPRVLFPVPEFELVDQTGGAFHSTDLRGKVWIANFIFTRCKATCPIQTAKLAEFQRQAQRWSDWDRVRLVSISVDPENDTPEVLAQYADSYRVAGNWKFLTGPREAIWKLSKEGFKLAVAEDPAEPGPITHSPRFVLVDGEGQIRGFYDSQRDDEIRQMTIDLRQVLDGK